MMLTINNKCTVGSVYIFLRRLITKAKIWCFALAFLFIFMPIVDAETITYNVCKNGCEYSDLNTVFNEINDANNHAEVIINILDNGEYFANSSVYNENVDSIKIFGNNNKINLNDSWIELVKNVYIENLILNIVNKSGIVGFTNFGNTDSISNGDHLDYKINISNVIINSTMDHDSYYIGLVGGEINTNNCIINVPILTMISTLYFNDSQISNSIITTGGGGIATRIYIPYGNYVSPIVREKNNEDIVLNNFVNNINSGRLIETYLSIETDMPKELTNNIFIYQEANKTIKENTNISEFEKEFVDTYKDSIGYDDIKDLPVEWKSQDETIAKVENGIIKVIKPGKVDIVGTKGNDIDTIHLTIESSSSGIIEKKETDTKNYAQADFSSSDLDSIIPLTNEEQSLKEAGKNVDVFLEVKEANETVAKEEKELIEEKLSSNEEIGTYLDVSLFKQVEGEEASKIEKTNGNIKVSLEEYTNYIINNMSDKLRTYKVTFKKVDGKYYFVSSEIYKS